MLKELQLFNFKGFKEHAISFRHFSIVVGRNNAGKSSAFEALRIIATIAKKFSSQKFVDSPEWTSAYGKGISLLSEDLEIKQETIFYQYSQPPATLKAIFSNNSQIQVFLGPNLQVHAKAINPEGREIHSRYAAREFSFDPICLLPQISPLRDSETVLRETYVKKCIDTQLSSRHFRNQIRYLHDHFDGFRDLFHQTWENVRISAFDSPNARHEETLSLLMREREFVAEIANFGHGLQMWLQIVWFLSRTNSQSIVIMDEPDVYMHPDQQKKMIDILRNRFQQCILSTHSPVVISRCNEDEILWLHRKINRSSCELNAAEYEKMVKLHDAVTRVDDYGDEQNHKGRKLTAVVYECGSLRVESSNGKLLLDVAAQRDSSQVDNPLDEESSDQIDFEPYTGCVQIDEDATLHISVGYVDDVALYIDGEPIPLEPFLDSDKTSGSFALKPETFLQGDS